VPVRRGVFIAFEGLEGSGKTTQAKLLSAWLETHGIDHILTREPGGTTVGEAIREILLHRDPVPPRAELLLMLAARATLLDQVVQPALAGGRVVIADRYELSTLAYQGYGRGIPLDDVRAINAFATGGLAPDLTILLDVPVVEGEARRQRDGRQADRIESAGADFHARVAEAYRALGDCEPGVQRLDGTGSTESVHEEVKRLLRRRFPETFPVS